MKRLLLILCCALGLASAQSTYVQANLDRTMMQVEVQNLTTRLSEGLSEFSTPQRWRVRPEVELTLQATGNNSLQIVSVVVEDTTNPSRLAAALRDLAEVLRVTATTGDRTLTTEIASLIQQTAAYLTPSAFAPRMAVEIP